MTLPFHSLIAWRRADDLFIELHHLSLTFPPIERFELARQLRRAAFSVPVNIVEDRHASQIETSCTFCRWLFPRSPKPVTAFTQRRAAGQLGGWVAGWEYDLRSSDCADKLHFLHVALSSLAEAGYCIHAAARLGYVEAPKVKELEAKIRRASAPLRGLMKSLGREHP